MSENGIIPQTQLLGLQNTGAGSDFEEWIRRR
eukprot:COSAG05_NODE_18056_length_314_cov_1.548837_1_plen_31_part_01